MSSKLHSYLSFRDNARQAMTFYQTVFGGKLDLSPFKDYNPSLTGVEGDKIMHAYLEAENGIAFMAADTPAGMEYHPGTNFSLSLSGDNEAELSGYFKKLAVGGTVTMPLEKSPWGDTFGMVTDQFGVNWVVNITAAKM